MEYNNPYSEEIEVEVRQWSREGDRSLKDGTFRGRWRGRRKERECECPQGESESEHPSLLWPAAVL